MSNQSTGQNIALSIKSEREKELIINTFKDNEELLKSLRAFLLGIADDNDRAIVLSLSPEIKEVIKDRFYPKMDKESPIGIISDPWLGIEDEIKGQSKDSIYQSVASWDMAIKRVLESLDMLDGKGGKIDLSVNIMGVDDYQVNLLARNKYIRLVNSQIFVLNTIANMKQETPVQTAKRLAKDSAQ